MPLASRCPVLRVGRGWFHCRLIICHIRSPVWQRLLAFCPLLIEPRAAGVGGNLRMVLNVGKL